MYTNNKVQVYLFSNNLIMKFQTLFTAFVLSATILSAQNKNALKFADQIDSLNIKSTLFKLASDEFIGRKSSNEGIKMAEEYLINKLVEYKIPYGTNGSYLQNINAHNMTAAKKYFEVLNSNFSKSYSYRNKAIDDSVIVGEKIVFAGYGIYDDSYNDFANIDITDKIVMLLSGDGPVDKFGVKYHNSRNVPSKEYLLDQQPKAVLMINNKFSDYSNYVSKGLRFEKGKDQNQYPTIEINELLANKILDQSGKTVKQLMLESESNSSESFEFNSEIKFNGNRHYEKADVNNVIAVIEGSDLKDEYVVLVAHYDHIGTAYNGSVYNGADDNASGVSSILEIARVLNRAKKKGKGPKRSVLVLFTTAEEDGLKGAEYFLENPIVPLDKIKVCVNIDMLGRIGNDISEDDIKQGYVMALTGNSEENDTLSGTIGYINSLTSKLAISSTSSSFYRRSDHYKFYEKGIPSVMFTNGVHEDLHKKTDDSDKIDLYAMTMRTRLVFFTLWEFANNPKPFRKFDNPLSSLEDDVEFDPGL